jgi:predicted transcriptional regulator with HTH domain
MAEGEFISFRKRSSDFDASKVLEALKEKKVGKTDSDLIRMGLRALARKNGIKVPA